MTALAPEPGRGVDGEAARALSELMIDIEAGRLPGRAVAMLYREEVLGESLDEIAEQIGVSVDGLRMRRNRAVAAIRRQLAA